MRSTRTRASSQRGSSSSSRASSTSCCSSSTRRRSAPTARLELAGMYFCELVFCADYYYYEDGNVLRDTRKSRIKYLKSSGFVLDLLALPPLSLLPVHMPHSVVLLEFHKFIRVRRLPELISNLDNIYARYFVPLKLAKVLGVTLVTSHFVVCARYSFGYDSHHNNHWLPEAPEHEQSSQTKYLMSLFWAFGLLTGLFEGELPHTNPQFAFTIFVGLCGFSLFTYLYATFFLLSKCESGDSETAGARVNQFKHILAFHRVSEKLQAQAVEYLKRYYTQAEANDREAARLLCPSISSDIQIELLKDTVAQIPVLKAVIRASSKPRQVCWSWFRVPPTLCSFERATTAMRCRRSEQEKSGEITEHLGLLMHLRDEHLAIEKQRDELLVESSRYEQPIQSFEHEIEALTLKNAELRGEIGSLRREIELAQGRERALLSDFESKHHAVQQSSSLTHEEFQRQIQSLEKRCEAEKAEKEQLRVALDKLEENARARLEKHNRDQEFLAQFKQQLVNGIVATKYGSRGNPHARVLFSDFGCRWISWKPPSSGVSLASPRADAKVETNDLVEVISGATTEVFLRQKPETSAKCFSLVFVHPCRTLDIEADTLEKCQYFLRGFRLLHEEVSQKRRQ